MNERRLIPIPDGPSPTPGVASIMPGASVARVRGAGAVRAGRVKLQSQAPNGIRRAEGVLQDGNALAAGAMGKARAALRKGEAVGNIFESIGHVMQARETAELLDADAQWKQAWQLYDAAKGVDPENWAEEWGEKLAELKDTHIPDDKIIGPMLRRKLNKNFEAFTAETGVRLQSMAIERNAQLARIKGMSAFGQYIDMEDLGSAQAALGAMVSRGVLSQEEADAKMQSASRQVNYAQRSRFAYDNPYEAEAMVDDWGMSPSDTFKTRKMIEGRKAEIQRDEFSGALEMTMKNRTLPEEDWRNMVGTFAPHLEATDIEQLSKHRLDTMEPDPDKLTDYWNRANQFSNLSTPEAFAKYAQFQYDVGRNIPTYLQSDLLSAANASMAAFSETATATEKAQAIQFKALYDGGVDIINAHYQDQLTFLTKRGNDKKTMDTYSRTIALKKAEANGLLLNWLKQNPEAKTQDVQNITASLLGLDASSMQDIMDRTSAAFGRLTPEALKKEEQRKFQDAKARALFRGANMQPSSRSYLENSSQYGSALNY